MRPTRPLCVGSNSFAMTCICALLMVPTSYNWQIVDEMSAFHRRAVNLKNSRSNMLIAPFHPPKVELLAADRFVVRLHQPTNYHSLPCVDVGRGSAKAVHARTGLSVRLSPYAAFPDPSREESAKSGATAAIRFSAISKYSASRSMPMKLRSS